MEIIRYVNEEALREFYNHEMYLAELVELSEYDIGAFGDEYDDEVIYPIRLVVPDFNGNTGKVINFDWEEITGKKLSDEFERLSKTYPDAKMIKKSKVGK